MCGKQINALIQLGKKIRELITVQPESSSSIQELFANCKANNGWFTEENVTLALVGISKLLDEQSLLNWYNSQQLPQKTKKVFNVGIVMAGNIPGAGFHDLLCVIVSGHRAIVRFSSDDRIFIEFLLEKLLEIEPELNEQIKISGDRLTGIDAIIATGSDNTSRYFEYYFGKYPNIIRKNRSSIAILNGNESDEDLELLGLDVFSYFGLGCRNVSKVYIPENFDVNKLFNAFLKYSQVLSNNKYANNYEYNRTLLLLKQVKFLDNNFVILQENNKFHAPVGIIHYEYYKNASDLIIDLNPVKDQIQCIVANAENFPGLSGIRPVVPFGKTQFPEITDYADGVDTMEFLRTLS